MNGHSYDNIHTLAPEFVRLGVFHEVLSLALEHQLTDELATASTKTPAGSAQDISELKSAVVQLTGCVQHLMGDSGSKQYKLFGNGSTPVRCLFLCMNLTNCLKFMPDVAAVLHSR